MVTFIIQQKRNVIGHSADIDYTIPAEDDR
jgi:hypothetical protein